MRKNITLILLFSVMTAGSGILISQEISHESLVISIEVPVRVFKGSTFVDDLTADDFDVYENGKLQKIRAVYLIKNNTIQRREEKKKYAPQTSRNFYLIFNLTQYTPKIGEAVDYFVREVLAPEDKLLVLTPDKTYRMDSQALKLLPRDILSERLQKMVKKDVTIGNSSYRSAFEDLTNLARALRSNSGVLDETHSSAYGEYSLREKIRIYSVLLKKLETMRSVDEERLLAFAQYLKDMEGQKYVFLLYQREFIPQLEQRVLDQYISLNQDKQDVIFNLTELFDFRKREITFDVNKVKQAYSDSSIAIHFMFFSKQAEQIPGIQMVEHSEDIFSSFREMAKATGGFAESSSNPIHLFQNASEASENYYLLYYSPLNYKKDGKFKSIKVKLKNKNYRVLHRAGYFAN